MDDSIYDVDRKRAIADTAARDRQHIVDTYDAEIITRRTAPSGPSCAMLRICFYTPTPALVVVRPPTTERNSGEHGKWAGMHTCAELTARAPLVPSCPSKAGTTVEETVRGIDSPHPLLAALGRSLPPSFEGRDALALWPPPAEAAEVWSSRDTHSQRDLCLAHALLEAH